TPSPRAHMAIRPLRQLPPLHMHTLADAWLERLRDQLQDPELDRARFCRETLVELLHPTFANSYETAVEDEKLPIGTRLALATLDPRNITLEPEYYADCDQERFQRVKPLLWLWYSFDRSPVGG